MPLEWRVTSAGHSGRIGTGALHSGQAIERAVRRMNREYRGKPLYDDVRVEVREVTPWVVDTDWEAAQNSGQSPPWPEAQTTGQLIQDKPDRETAPVVNERAANV
jgi:hypothetical protein